MPDEELSIPQKSVDLIRKLEKLYPVSTFDPSLTHVELAHQGGKRFVVDHLLMLLEADKEANQGIASKVFNNNNT